MNLLTLISLALSLALSAYSLPRRIIGGHEISIEEIPYQVGLFYESEFLCGGALISKSYVLTAAHCVEGTKSRYSVKINSASSDFEDETGMKIDVTKVIKHPDYNDVITDYDFAILKLSDIEGFPENFEFAKLPSLNDEILDHENVSISGWGLTEDFEYPEMLRRAFIQIVSPEKCQEAYEGFPLTDRMLCAGSEKDQIGTCFGDSGSPLVRVSDGILFGVTSFGRACASPKYPTIYAKVSSVLDWIYHNTKL